MKIQERVRGAIYGWKQGIQRDQLTGLLTRNFFEHEIWLKEEARAKRYERPVSIVFIDMDGLKDINDRKGHLAGDRAIRRLVAGMLRQVRSSDVLIRYGGDEFLLLLPETDEVLARSLMDRIKEGMAATAKFSFGVAQWRDGLGLNDLISMADRELYKQKEQKETKSKG